MILVSKENEIKIFNFEPSGPNGPKFGSDLILLCSNTNKGE